MFATANPSGGGFDVRCLMFDFSSWSSPAAHQCFLRASSSGVGMSAENSKNLAM
jgi:hypothetical protein